MVLFLKTCSQKALDRSQKYISQKWLLVKYLLYGVMVDLDVHIKGGHWAPERNTNCFCLASPSMRGLNPPERNSPLYPTTSPQHGPSPQQKLQQRENYFHYDDLLIGQLKKKSHHHQWQPPGLRREEKANEKKSNAVSFGSRQSCSFYKNSSRPTPLRAAHTRML